MGLSAFLASHSDQQPKLTTLDRYSGLRVGISSVEKRSIHHLVNSPRLERFLRQAREEYDYIILDTPPMLAATDSESLALLADTATLVVRADFMYTTAVNDCLDKLRRSCRDITGIVLNNYYKLSH